MISIFNKTALLYVPVLLCVCAFTSCHTSRQNVSRHEYPHFEDIRSGKTGKKQKKIVEEAYSWIGTPYKYAASEKGKATDCSGLVMKVFENATGLKLPRNSAKQAEFCDEIKAEEVDIGDLVFFATGKDSNRISHVGIVVDNESFIHASSSKGVVVSKFANNYYRRTFIKFGRVPCLK